MNSSKKRTNDYYYDTSGRLVFVRFLEKLKIPKRHFEINWPLNINSPSSPRPGRPCPLARPVAVPFEKLSKIKRTEKFIWHQTFWQNYPQWVLTLEWLVICTEKKSEKLAHLRLLFRKPYRWELRVWCERHAILMQHNWANFFKHH